MKITWLRLIGLFVGIFLFFASAAAQNRWQPFKLHPDVSFLDLQYSIQNQQGDTLVYGIQVERLQHQQVKLKILSEARLAEDQLGAQTLLGFWGVFGVSHLIFFNPAFAMFYSQMDLNVGEKMSFFGAGYAKVTGEKVVGGRKGKVVEFYQREDGKDRLVSKTVIDPKIFIPIENIMFDNSGRIEMRFSLLKATVK